MQKMLMTTSNILEGYEIINYLGLITSVITTGTGFFVDLKASINDIIGGTSEAYNKELKLLNDKIIDSLHRNLREWVLMRL